MPAPKPRKKEKQEDFITRCMGDEVMKKDYDQEQRLAICLNIFSEKSKGSVTAGKNGQLIIELPDFEDEVL
jgi:hypothetical protein